MPEQDFVHIFEYIPMQETKTTAAIILAAGSSSRMGGGRHKLLLPLGRRPVLAHVLEAALASQARPIIVVVGHQANQVRAQIAAYDDSNGVSIVENPAYLKGMSTSLQAGVQTLLTYGYKKDEYETSARTTVDSALVLLGDQPLITPQVIDALIDARTRTGKCIIAPLIDGKRGNPILFAADLFPELLEVTGDEGGRSVVERHRSEVATIEIASAATIYDVDTWEAYQQVVEAWERHQRMSGEQ
jgi:molybdenum cofactor cytidylyltransferase